MDSDNVIGLNSNSADCDDRSLLEKRMQSENDLFFSVPPLRQALEIVKNAGVNGVTATDFAHMFPSALVRGDRIYRMVEPYVDMVLSRSSTKNNLSARYVLKAYNASNISSAAKNRSSDSKSVGIRNDLKEFRLEMLKEIINTSETALIRIFIQKELQDMEKSAGYHGIITKKTMSRLLATLVKQREICSYKPTSNLKFPMMFYYNKSWNPDDPRITEAFNKYDAEIETTPKRNYLQGRVVVNQELYRLAPAKVKTKLGKRLNLKEVQVRYGFGRYFANVKVFHQFLYYIVYENRPTVNVTSDGNPQCYPDIDFSQFFSTDSLPRIVFNDSDSLYRYIAPISHPSPVNQGWFNVKDILVRLPIAILCKIMRFNFDVPEVLKLTEDPNSAGLTLFHLPIEVRQQIYCSLVTRNRSYPINSFRSVMECLHEFLVDLVLMGLLSSSTGLPVSFEMTEPVFFLHKGARVVDTSTTPKCFAIVPGAPENYPEIVYSFDSSADVDLYWALLERLVVSVAESHHTDYQTAEEKGLIDSHKHVMRASFINVLSTIPSQPLNNIGTPAGNRRGFAGMDYRACAHMLQKWKPATMTKSKGDLKRKVKKKKLKRQSRITDKDSNQSRANGAETDRNSVEMNDVSSSFVSSSSELNHNESAEQSVVSTFDDTLDSCEDLMVNPLNVLSETSWLSNIDNEMMSPMESCLHIAYANDLKRPADSPVLECQPALKISKTIDKSPEISSISKSETVFKLPAVVNIEKQSNPAFADGFFSVLPDEVDRKAKHLMAKERSCWTTEEDRILLICRVAAYLLTHGLNEPPDSSLFAQLLLLPMQLFRDFLYENCPNSRDKTKIAAQRRLKRLLKRHENLSQCVYLAQVASTYEDISNGFPDIPKKKQLKYTEKLAKVMSEHFTQIAYKLLRIPTPSLEENPAAETLPTRTALQKYPSSLAEFYEMYDVKCKTTGERSAEANAPSLEEIRNDVLRNLVMSTVINEESKPPQYQLIRQLFLPYSSAEIQQVIDHLKAAEIISKKKGAMNPKAPMPVLEQYHMCKSFRSLLRSKGGLNLPDNLSQDVLSYIENCKNMEDSVKLNEGRTASATAVAAIIQLAALNATKLRADLPENVITCVQKRFSGKDLGFSEKVQDFDAEDLFDDIEDEQPGDLSSQSVKNDDQQETPQLSRSNSNDDVSDSNIPDRKNLISFFRRNRFSSGVSSEASQLTYLPDTDLKVNPITVHASLNNVECLDTDLRSSDSVIKHQLQRLQAFVPIVVDVDSCLVMIKKKCTHCGLVYEAISSTETTGIDILSLKLRLPNITTIEQCITDLLEEYCIIRVGIREFRYVSHKHIRPWLVESLCNLKGRSCPSDLAVQINNEDSGGVTTWKRVTFVPRPWKTCTGTINRNFFIQLLRCVLYYLFHHPSSEIQQIVKRLEGKLHFVIIAELLEVLTSIGAVSVKTVLCSEKTHPFGKTVENLRTYYSMPLHGFTKFGHFVNFLNTNRNILSHRRS